MGKGAQEISSGGTSKRASDEEANRKAGGGWEKGLSHKKTNREIRD